MAEYLSGPDIKAEYDTQDGHGGELRRRIEEARDLLAGKLKAPIDASIMPGERDREALRASLSQKYTLSLKLLNKLLEKSPRVLREQSASGIAAERHATEIERAGNAGMDHLYPRAAVIDNLLNEGECAVRVLPAMAHWASLPSMHEDGDPEKAIKAAYAVDSKGRASSDPWYGEGGRKFKADAGKSAAYFRQRESDYRARHIPVVMEAISRLNGIPINPRRVGKRYEIDGFIERRSFLASSLIERGYRWGDSLQMQESDRTNATHHLYAYYGMCSKGPYVSYCVDGMKTWKMDGSELEQSDAVINLRDKLGLERIPIAYDYGWSFPGVTNPNDRGVPFVSPFGRSWLALDTLITMLLVRAWRASSMFLMYKPDAELLKTLGRTDKVPMPKLEANRITPVLGDLMDLPDMSIPEVGQVIALLGQSISSETPSADALGSNRGVSGYARNEAEEGALGILEQVQQADLNLYGQAASMWLEQASRIGERHGKVVVFVSEEVPNSTGRTSRAKLEIEPSLFDGDFDVVAEYPREIGDNMALTQQLMEAHQRGEIPQRVVLEQGFGFSNPDEIIAELEAERARNSPLGQARLMQWAAQIAGDEEEAAIMEAMAAQELMKLQPEGPNTQGNTLPMGAATAGVPGPAMTGMGMPNIAASSLGGVVAGAMQTGPQTMEGMASA